MFQADDGIRAGHVTGVQTCALPISLLIVAPPARFTVTVPFVTASCTVLRLPSTSVTLMPPTASAVSSLTTCAPGTVFTGASDTASALHAPGPTAVPLLLETLITVSGSAPL